MNELVLSGEWESALSHLALFGVAAILEDSGDRGVRVHWQPHMVARPTVTTRLSLGEVAEAVHKHATDAAAGWVSATFNHQSRRTGTMSPRVSTPKTPSDWQALQAAREAVTLGPGLTFLDQRMIAALGEPGYWCHSFKGEPEPKWAASPWEMKTRNRGEEFVQNRLAKLADAVSARSSRDVLAGLTGSLVRDEAGGDAVDSRTPTGLTPPRRTDNALAWCALWGISQTTVRPRTRSQSASPGFRNRSYASGVYRTKRGTLMALPVFRAPTRMPVVRAVLRGAQLQQVALDSEGTAAEISAAGAIQWLVSKGCGAVMVFRQVFTDNPNAPEPWLQGGRRIPLRS